MSTMVDLKSCLDSSPKRFRYDVRDYQYDISAAFYSDFGLKNNYIFMAVEKAEPFQACLYQLSDSVLNYGREKYRMALDLLAWCYKHSYWPAYSEFELLKRLYKLDLTDSFFEQKELEIDILTIE